jgi:transposase
MSVTPKPISRLRQSRTFSEEFKRQKVQQIVDKLLTISDVTETYNVTRTTVYRWLHKYSSFHEKGISQVVQLESEAHKTKLLLQQVAELERSIGQKQLKIDYLEKLVEVAGHEFNVDLKKKFDGPSSNGSGNTKMTTLGK